jgi:Zn-dependent peptidase ImmA (M78 family)
VSFKAPYLLPHILRQKAEKFLSQYHPTRTIPIPIDWIIESQFEMEIIPLAGLEKSFDTVAFLASNLREIYIDDYVYRKQLTRYRFTIAHELGHRILHGELFQQFKRNTIDDLKYFIEKDVIPEDQYSFLELHANTFAGLILVPPTELEKQFSNYIAKAKDAGIELEQIKVGGQKHCEDFIAKIFQVSKDVIKHRLKADNLWDIPATHC